MKRTFILLFATLNVFCFSTAKGQQPVTAPQASLSDTIDLFPATIVALHPRAGEVETLDLNYLDQLAHDGGAQKEPGVLTGLVCMPG